MVYGRFNLFCSYAHEEEAACERVLQAFDRHWLQQCRIVPVILRDCRWTAPSFGSVADGIRVVCRAIVDWASPSRRAAIGDWTLTEQSMLVEQTGQKMTVTIELRVLAKTKRRNRVAVGFMARRDGQNIPLGEFQLTGFAGGD